MKNIQNWLNENYFEHAQIEEIYFPRNEKLTGELVIADFPKLKKICISSSKIKIPYLVIINCPQIEEIKVSFAGLKKIEADHCLEKLEVLELDFNSLSFIPSEFLYSTLKKIDISYNEITVLPEDIYELINLESFSCRGNRDLFGNFDITVFPKLTHIDLRDTKIPPLPISLEE